MFFYYIGLAADEQRVVIFYALFGGFLGLVPFIVDLIISDNSDLPLETMSYENNSPLPFLRNFWVQLVSSIVLGVLVFLRVQYTQQAFVKAPSFHLVVPLGSTFADKAANAFLSGITGGIFETIVFWGFFFPTCYAVLRKNGFGKVEATIISIVFAAFVFALYHWWRYGYLITALIMVFAFGLIQGILAWSYRSMLPLFTTHFMNNFAVVLLTLTAYSVLVFV